MTRLADEPVDSLALRCERLGEGRVDGEEAAALSRAELARAEGTSGGPGREPLVEATCRRAVTTLLLRALPGEEPRQQLGRLWAGEVLRWCRWLCGRRLDPQDIAHDVLLTFMARAEQIRDPAAAEAWLRRATLRAVRAEGRRAWLRRRAPMPAEQADPTPGPEEALARAGRLALVRAVLDEQRQAHREVLVLHYMEGLSRAELARQLDLPEGSLGRLLTQARADFERRARRRGLDPSLPEPQRRS